MSARALSVVVLTLDEEALVERCVLAHRWADEVLVVDSGSTDRTRELARAAGARVVEQPWLGWTRQRDAAARAATHDWVLFVDCDEVVDATLRTSIHDVLAHDPDPRAGFSVDRRNEWLGILLPNDQRRRMIHSFVRLFHRGHSHYDPEAVVHERVIVAGRTRLLDGVLLQWRHETLTAMTARATRYAGVETDLALQDGRRAARVRAAAMPAVRMAWVLLLRRNLLLGTAGVLHALHKANGEWMRQLTLFERLEPPAITPGTVEAVMTRQNDQPARRRSWPAVRIWWAVPRLLGIAALGAAGDPQRLLQRYDGWNRTWLEAAKTWEAAHVVARPHPPGHEPPTGPTG